MCIDPVTALSIGSGVIGAAGSMMGSSANARQAGIAAQVAQANSQMALNEGEGRVAQIGQHVDQAIGRTRAAFGAGNIAINSGSSLNDQVMSAIQGNTDKQLAMAGALNQSAGQRFQAASDYQKQGQEQMAGIFGAGTALLNSLTSVYRGGGPGAPAAAGSASGGTANIGAAWAAPFQGIYHAFGLG
jgi:hypothetical protein